MEVLLLGHYELGRQSFGLASAAAWLRAAGCTVEARDLSRQPLPLPLLRRARLIALYLPMHTATRLAASLLPRLRREAPSATICCCGLYAPLNADYLRRLGADSILGPEFEADLAALAQNLPQAPSSPAAATWRGPERSDENRQSGVRSQRGEAAGQPGRAAYRGVREQARLAENEAPRSLSPRPIAATCRGPERSGPPLPAVEAGPQPRPTGAASRIRAAPPPSSGLPRLRFLAPERAGLPPLADYARLVTAGGARVTGYTEASRGCKHLCRHCPIVPVYGGRFRVVAADVVLEDVRRQVAAGAEHITFGDPDFFNGPAHALRIVRALHAAFPRLTYDVTIKIEHLLAQARWLPELRATGCVLVTSAVESLDDAVLERLDKGHTRADFERVLPLLADHGLAFNPTFVPFTPWITPEGYRELLRALAALGLAEAVAPIQLGIRLLLPRGSRILELPDAGEWLGEFDEATLSYRWRNPDPAVEDLHARVQSAIAAGVKRGAPRADIFAAICRAAAVPPPEQLPPRELIPYLDEPWFC